jgi:hypothetical protein
VTSDHERRRVVTDVLLAAGRAGLPPRGLVPSPLTGAEGNRELLLWTAAAEPADLDPEVVATMVGTAIDRRPEDHP